MLFLEILVRVVLIVCFESKNASVVVKYSCLFGFYCRCCNKFVNLCNFN